MKYKYNHIKEAIDELIVENTILINENEFLKEVLKEHFDTIKTGDIHNIELSNIPDIPLRVTMGLKSLEIKTLGDLAEFEKADIRRIRNFGNHSMVKLEEIMKKYNIKFKNEY